MSQIDTSKMSKGKADALEAAEAARDKGKSGVKSFRFADPVIHEDLFKVAEKYAQNISGYINQNKYSFLLKLFDRAEIINTSEI